MEPDNELYENEQLATTVINEPSAIVMDNNIESELSYENQKGPEEIEENENVVIPMLAMDYNVEPPVEETQASYFYILNSEPEEEIDSPLQNFTAKCIGFVMYSLLVIVLLMIVFLSFKTK